MLICTSFLRQQCPGQIGLQAAHRDLNLVFEYINIVKYICSFAPELSRDK
nr:MAG TPA: hypothetical protein [Caudoviricetes sp.]